MKIINEYAFLLGILEHQGFLGVASSKELTWINETKRQKKRKNVNVKVKVKRWQSERKTIVRKGWINKNVWKGIHVRRKKLFWLWENMLISSDVISENYCRNNLW